MKVEEHLNARDLIASILQNGNEVVTMEYNVAAQKTKQTYANGITTDYGYNENGWLSAIKDDHKILSLAMSYDAIGNMTKRADNLDASRTESYGYDAISQLTSYTRGKTVNKTYQFDLLGNRVKTVENGVVTNYTSNNVNAYTAISGGMSFTPSYDGNGNMLNDDKHQYVYDYNNKLASVDDKSVSYKYDALGRRIAKNNTLYYYVGDQMVEEDTDGAVTSYLYGNNIDEALQMNRNGEAYYYHTNHLGSSMGLSNKEGKVIERVEYDVYGMPTFMDADGKVLEKSAVENNILFTGREYNAETGDYFFRARNMHPMVGRFMQKDPLMYVDGMNDYLYVINNSIVITDIYGFSSISDYTDFNSEVTGNMSNMLGGIGDYKWGSNNKIYSPKFHGNQHVSIKGKLENVGKLLGIGSTLLSAPGNYEKMANSNNFEEYGGHLGNWTGSSFGGMAGAEFGTSAGAAIGAWFGGVGAIPGAIIGGLAGGIIGSIGGGYLGGRLGENIGKRFDPKPINTCYSNNDNPNRPFCKAYPSLCEEGFCDENPRYCKMKEADMAIGQAWVNR